MFPCYLYFLICLRYNTLIQVAVYLYVKILDGLNVKDDEANKVLKNYLLKQVIYSETGNLSLDVSSDTAKYMQFIILFINYSLNFNIIIRTSS